MLACSFACRVPPERAPFSVTIRFEIICVQGIRQNEVLSYQRIAGIDGIDKPVRFGFASERFEMFADNVVQRPVFDIYVRISNCADDVAFPGNLRVMWLCGYKRVVYKPFGKRAVECCRDGILLLVGAGGVVFTAGRECRSCDKRECDCE